MMSLVSMWLVLGVTLPVVVVALGCWAAYQLLLQNRRIILRLKDVEADFNGAAERMFKLNRQLVEAEGKGALLEGESGLPVGSPAPAFDLPALDGSRMSLEQFRGHRLVLVFWSPTCPHCVRMASDLATLAQGDARPALVLVSTGNPEENRRLAKDHGLRCPVLLQEKWEVGVAYQAPGTPMAYLLDEGGAIASPKAMGPEPVLALARGEVPATDGRASTPGSAGKATRPLSESRIGRDGLKAGTLAPSFRLPRVDGGELSLEDYRGRRVLLVFSDPECEPCDQLASELERLHRRRAEFELLMVSRGSVKANRAKISEHGLTFPVLLQRQWEISRSYAKFATPIAYLLDEQGVIAADLAAGRDEILALASRASGGGEGGGV